MSQRTETQRKQEARKLVDTHIRDSRIQDPRTREKALAALSNVTHNLRHDSYEVELDGLVVYFMVNKSKAGNIRLTYLGEYPKGKR